MLGSRILMAILFVVFQSVFAWATPLMDAIEAGFAALGQTVSTDDSDPICMASWRRRSSMASAS